MENKENRIRARIVVEIDGYLDAPLLVGSGEDEKADMDPVSYTHLDVYKRQAGRCTRAIWGHLCLIWRQGVICTWGKILRLGLVGMNCIMTEGLRYDGTNDESGD